MKRSDFIKNSAICSFALSSLEYVRFDGHAYIGDCATTPISWFFYRPGTPGERFMKLHFELLPFGSVKLTMLYNNSEKPLKYFLIIPS